MLIDLIQEVDKEERYTHVFNEDWLVLDHIMISPSLLTAVSETQRVHFNADFSAIIHGTNSNTGSEAQIMMYQ